MRKDRLVAISLFSGGGGLDLGVAEAGFETRVAVELERHACQTLRGAQDVQHELESGLVYLAECKIMESDIREVPAADVLAEAGVNAGEPALLVGGPACVSFSVAGRREGLRSPSGLLYLEFARMLRELRPAAFIFENVKGMVTAPGVDGSDETALQTIVRDLGACGYAVSWIALDAADFGVPQHRHRVIVLGRRGNAAPFSFPAATHAHPAKAAGAKRSWRTVRDAFEGLPAAVRYGEEPLATNHVARRHSAEVVASFKETAPGQRNPIYKRDRLKWDEPAKTVRAQGKPKKDGGGSLHSSHAAIHPEEHRQLTVREAARLQTFPDWYSFDKTLVNGHRIVGDAVPPLLAKLVAGSIRTQLLSTPAPPA